MASWVFRARPDWYRIRDAIAELEQDSWSITAHSDRIRPGDTVYVWEAGLEAGIYCRGTVLEGSSTDLDYEADIPYWSEPGRRPPAGARRALVSYEYPLLDQPILATNLAALGIELAVVRSHGGSIFRVEEGEAQTIDKVIRERLTGAATRPVADVPVEDAQVPARRTSSVVSRIVRDSARATQLKALYENRCQVCGESTCSGDGSRYVEAHHLRPLGAAHLGPDVEANMLVLCPNHHAEFDLGAIALEPDSLTLIHVARNDHWHGKRLSLLKHELHANCLKYARDVLFGGSD